MRNLLIILSLFFLVGCSVNKTFSATGGSKADGIVTLSYQHNWIEIPTATVADENAYETAKGRCQNWGYSDATPFDEFTTRCIAYSGVTCSEWRISIDYQCID